MPKWIAASVLFASAFGALFYFVATRGGARTPTPPSISQEAIEEELAALQRAFQTALQEKQDLGRLAAQARVFTERHPDQQAGYVLLAQTRMGLKQWDLAYDAWQRALEDDASAFELNKMAGLSAAKLGELAKALAHYEQAVQATNDQADSEVYAALGRLHLSLDEPDRAQEMFERAAEAPGPGEETNYKHQAYAGLADVASVRGDVDAALSWIDRSIRLANLDSKADNAGYHIQKARIYMDAQRDDDAVTMLGYTWSQFADAPWRIESARLRAKLFERANERDKAVDYLQSVTEWHRMSEQRDNKTLADFTALLADWQVKADRRDDAQISLHNLQTLAPEHPAIDELKAKLR